MGGQPKHGAEVYMGRGGSGGQEAPIHWHSGACGHATSVTQQEKDGVHHVLHFCGPDGGQSVNDDCPSSFPSPLAPRQEQGPLVQLNSNLDSCLTHQQTCQVGCGPAKP
jgi:hypothetical protein